MVDGMDGDSMSTLSDAMRALQAEGYTGNWYASEEGMLRCSDTGADADPPRSRSSTCCGSRASPTPTTR